MFKNKSFFHSISSLFWNGFGSVFLRFFGGTNGCESKKQKNQKPHETLRMRIEFEGRLVEQNLKNNKKQLKTACFFGHRFWIDFGWVLGRFWEAKIIDFRTFVIICSMQTLECKLEGHFGGQKVTLSNLPVMLGQGRWNGGGPLATPRTQRVQLEHVKVPYACHP